MQVKLNIGESGLAVYCGQMQKAVDTTEILNVSMNIRIFLTLLTVYCVMFLKQVDSCCWYTAKQWSVR